MKFSIAIPAFKSAFLKECIDSVLNQTYKNFELIIVNDHSPEDIRGIIEQFADIRIRYYENKKGFGAKDVVNNWNKCLEYATGDYILCMGDDDKLKSNCLSDYVALINQFPNLDVFHAMTELIDESSTLIKILSPRPKYETVYQMIWERWNGRSMFIGDYLYKVSTLRQHGGFFYLPFAWGSDAISAYIAATPQGIANTQRPGFQYRVNSQSISRKHDNIKGKILALQKERLWFEDFFKGCPNDQKDIEILTRLQENIDIHFQKMYADDIVYGISMNLWSQSLYWISHAYENKLSIPFIMKCLVRGLFYHIRK
ncbi:MAG: glycosyltransferase family 2 protein [Hoylesella enoeca]|uniref:glycosyltransferase family 2 protein n=1 Tax=Hoylesella enoeca TaxID=76123 RepID=UPI003F9FA558